MNDKEKKELIQKYGWSTLWHKDNWVHTSMTNPDYCGVSLESAYDSVMNNKNNEGYERT